jgi:hypothetical protein
MEKLALGSLVAPVVRRLLEAVNAIELAGACLISARGYSMATRIDCAVDLQAWIRIQNSWR